MSARRSGDAKRRIAIRMYNVGFGDCFLLRLPTRSGERTVLVDCGYHSQGKGRFSDKELVGQIKEDLAGEGLDVVVATHRHQDHISGFGETDLWRDVSAEEVWLPFTAAPDADRHPAMAAWERLLRVAPQLVNADGTLTALAQRALGARTSDEQAAAAFMLWNARSNAPGIENLRRGFKNADGKAAVRRYLPEDGADVPTSFVTAVLPDARIHVLGPPRDRAYRGKRKVPSGWGLLEDGIGPGSSGDVGSPFGPEWHIPTARLPSRRPFQDRSLDSMRLFNDDLLAAATAVDGFLNGESLVLVLEFGSARLLLPGDAEVGSWMKILEDPKAVSLAGGATFVKIGHHGSHNATPLIFLEEHLARRTPAMMSTQEGPGRYRNGIPREEILKRLDEFEMPLGRSDRPMKEREGIFTADRDGRWIDCALPC